MWLGTGPYVCTGPAGLGGGTYGVLTMVTHEVEVSGCGFGAAGVGTGAGDGTGAEYGGKTIVVRSGGMDAGCCGGSSQP